MRLLEVFADDERTIRLKAIFFMKQGFRPLHVEQTSTGAWRMLVEEDE